MRRVRRRFVVVGVLLVGAALVWRASTSRAPAPPLEPLASDTTATGLRAALLWFASPDGDSLVAEPREMPEESALHARVASLVAALEQGPRQGG